MNPVDLDVLLPDVTSLPLADLLRPGPAVLDQVLRRLLDGGGECYAAFDSALPTEAEHA